MSLVLEILLHFSPFLLLLFRRNLEEFLQDQNMMSLYVLSQSSSVGTQRDDYFPVSNKHLSTHLILIPESDNIWPLLIDKTF